MIDHIALSPEKVDKLCPKCKALLIDMLGLAYVVSKSGGQTVPEDGDWEYAELGLQAARAFLLGCSDKTRLALQLIIEAGETFSMFELERQMNADRGSLRALWGGLTKRTRTITGDPDALLINWDESSEDGDYVGRLTDITRHSFKRVLAE